MVTACLTSLHSGDSLGVLAKCPVSLVGEGFVYVASLGFGKYSVYTRNELKIGLDELTARVSNTDHTESRVATLTTRLSETQDTTATALDEI